MATIDQEITVTDVDGKRRRATLLTCCNCRSSEWLCFIVQGQNHSHFQCIGCGISYCPDGTCGEPKPPATIEERWTIPDEILESEERYDAATA